MTSTIFRKDLPPIVGAEKHELPSVTSTEVAEVSHTLIDMAQDYAYFYLGVLTRFRPWLRRDLAGDFCQLLAKHGTHPPIRIDYVEQFVRGVSCREQPGCQLLDCQLHAIPHDSADRFRDMLTSCAFMEQSTGIFAKIVADKFQIIDPFALKKMSVVTEPPLIEVTFLGLSSTQGLAYVENCYPAKPRLTFKPSQPDIVNLRDTYNQQISNG